MNDDEFWIDLQAASESGMSEDEFKAYLDRRAYERAIELLGDFMEVYYA